VGLFVANLIWLVISWRDRRVAEREYDSICERIRREGREEIEGLVRRVQTHEDTIREHEAQIAGRDATIKNLQSEREESAKRILSLEDSYREKCKETGAMNWEVNAGRDVRAAAFELCEMLDQFVSGMDGSRAKNLFAPETFQPKRPEEQPQKPTCDN
jgi:hypothetical protein